MWYDTVTKESIENTIALTTVLEDIAESRREEFDPDSYIDDVYPSVEYFDSTFDASAIVKALDPILYEEIRDDFISNWVNDILYRLERVTPELGESIAFVLGEDDEELNAIIWTE